MMSGGVTGGQARRRRTHVATDVIQQPPAPYVRCRSSWSYGVVRQRKLSFRRDGDTPACSDDAWLALSRRPVRRTHKEPIHDTNLVGDGNPEGDADQSRSHSQAPLQPIHVGTPERKWDADRRRE